MKLIFKTPMDRNQAFSTLTSSHDSLRTQFVSTSERIYSIIQPIINMNVESFTDLQDYIIATKTFRKDSELVINNGSDVEYKKMGWFLNTHIKPFVSTSDYSIIHPTINMNVESFTDMQDHCDKNLQKGFQVGDQQWWRCGLQEDGLVMVLTTHYVLYVGWSLGLLINNLFDCYERVSITKSIPFKRVVERVVEYIESQDAETTRNFWTQFLKGIEVDHGLLGKQNVTNTDSSPIIK